MDINNALTTAGKLPFSISQYIERMLKQPTDFSGADRNFQQQYQHPSLMAGPGGSWIDPQQANDVNATDYLSSRGATAEQDIMNKMNLAGDLTQSSSVYANMMNAIPFLNAMNIKGGMQSNIFGQLGF